MASRKEINFLKSRWDDIKIPNLKAALSSHLKPFGFSELNKIDYRGVDLSCALNQVEINNVDFSFMSSSFGQLGGGAQFISCLFDNMKYEGSLCSSFKKCTFKKSNLSKSTIVDSFDDCDFTETKFQNVRASEVKFNRCVFNKSNFKKASFYNCIFNECHFDSAIFGGGSLGGSRFKDCIILNVDFGNTIIEGVTGIADAGA